MATAEYVVPKSMPTACFILPLLQFQQINNNFV